LCLGPRRIDRNEKFGSVALGAALERRAQPRVIDLLLILNR
jgi:hypothetical protein